MADNTNDDAKPGEGERIPPKLDLSRGGSNLGDTVQIKVPASGSEAPTLKIKPATAVGRPAPPISGEPKKSETSRIPLEAATTAPGDGKGKPTGAPKTIRIRPVTKTMPPVAVAAATATGAPAPGATVPIPAAPATLEDKRKTSRISLDSVMATEPKAAAAEGGEGAETADAIARPKTIRLKRPAEAATVKIARPPGDVPSAIPAAPPPSAADAQTVMSKTARIDGLAEGADTGDVAPTQRKTIRVKRPTTSQPVHGLSIRRTEEEEGAEETAAELQVPQIVLDEPNFMFPIVALAAVIVACVCVYVLSAQAFGPNASLSQVSVWPTGPDMPWPGKVPIAIR